VTITREEGQLVIRIVEEIVNFAQAYPIEFHSYCPTDRWQESLTKVGTWSQEIEKQLRAGRDTVTIPADALLHLIDLEKCVSAARDARLDSSKTAFMLSAGGAIADIVFGLKWVGIPAYLGGLAILLGRPLMAKLTAEPQDPYKPALTGSCAASMGDHTDKRKILERVLVCPEDRLQEHWWGTVLPAPSDQQAAICLAKGRFRIRVEGWSRDSVTPMADWSVVAIGECDARRSIAVWEPPEAAPRITPFGPIQSRSGFDESYWVEYTGPLTRGVRRIAGPFG
jgi:hypothetical protein